MEKRNGRTFAAKLHGGLIRVLGARNSELKFLLDSYFLTPLFPLPIPHYLACVGYTSPYDVPGDEM